MIWKNKKKNRMRKGTEEVEIVKDIYCVCVH